MEEDDKPTIKTIHTVELLHEELTDEMGNISNKEVLHGDLFSMLYSPQYSKDEEGTYYSTVGKVENTEEFIDLRKETSFDDVLSYIGATKLLEHLDENSPKQQPQTSNKQSDGKNQSEQTVMQEVMRKAINQTKKDVENSKSAITSMGIEPGELKNVPIEDKVKLISHLLRENSTLFKKIMDLANRMLAKAKNEMIKDPEYLPTKISRVHLSDDISHLAEPSVLLDDDMFDAAYADKKLVTYDIRDRWEKKRGPIIVMIDTSGSMDTNRTIWSKAIAVVLHSIAKEQNRRMRAVLFSSYGENEIIDFKNDKNEMKKVLDLITHSFGGGTSFESPYRTAIDFVERDTEFHDASMIFITDGESNDMQDETKDWLKEFIEDGNKNIIMAIDSEGYNIKYLENNIPSTIVFSVDSSKINTPEKIISVLKGEMYVRRSLFRSKKTGRKA